MIHKHQYTLPINHATFVGMHPLSLGIFHNQFTDHFPGDETGNPQPRSTPGMLYSLTTPTPVKSPLLLAWSNDLAAELGIAFPNDSDLQILGGNQITASMKPYAACYAGHQFGHWAGQLGDGRAITLGEWQKPDGGFAELQLKGSGITPYSRGADGRAVLRSSLREYLMSEAMHHLGVPTTRALSLVSTGDGVMRDMFYNGFPEMEPGAIVMRVAPSFLRFGNFEILAARKEIEQLQRLVNWTISRYFPDINGEEKILLWFEEVLKRTAKLMVEWMRVGFVHGVMNTDNMSVLGLTIDYGPFSFLDDYDSNFTPNTTDLPGRRYAFDKQAQVGQWNLGCFAGALAPLVKDAQALVAILENYATTYWRFYYEMMAGKLGLDEVRDDDIAFILEWNKMLDNLHPDMTIFYQLLASMDAPSVEHFNDSFYDALNEDEQLILMKVLTQYHQRINTNHINKVASQEKMKLSNPRFILRNYLLQQAIEFLQNGDDSLFNKLQIAIKSPYSNANDLFFVKRPDWAKQKAGCSMLSCSS